MESPKLINEQLEDMKFKVIDPGLKLLFVPNEKGLNAARELGKKIAATLPSK